VLVLVLVGRMKRRLGAMMVNVAMSVLMVMLVSVLMVMLASVLMVMLVSVFVWMLIALAHGDTGAV
jgi:hypothetical protein